VDGSEDVPAVDFASGRLVAARVVAHAQPLHVGTENLFQVLPVRPDLLKRLDILVHESRCVAGKTRQLEPSAAALLTSRELARQRPAAAPPAGLRNFRRPESDLGSFVCHCGPMTDE
jgi:hypothetical protein